MTLGLAGPGPSNPAAANVFLTAARWAESLLLGSLATSLVVIAIGSIGFLMLSGRINLRRGAAIILGCFILFGATTIVRGFQGMAGRGAETAAAVQATPPPPERRPR